MTLGLQCRVSRQLHALSVDLRVVVEGERCLGWQLSVPGQQTLRYVRACWVQVMGRTRTNRPVFLDGDIEELRGKLVRVLITECRPWSLTGVRRGEAY